MPVPHLNLLLFWKWSTFVDGILDMTLEGLGEMFEGYSAETCPGKFPLVRMGG